MSIIELIETNKEKILPELFSWAETFNPENMIYNRHNIDEDVEIEYYKSYKYVFGLAEKLNKGTCNKRDYKEILFHIEQINYEETIISL